MIFFPDFVSRYTVGGVFFVKFTTRSKKKVDFIFHAGSRMKNLRIHPDPGSGMKIIGSGIQNNMPDPKHIILLEPEPDPFFKILFIPM
jgi:hypothetical protein